MIGGVLSVSERNHNGALSLTLNTLLLLTKNILAFGPTSYFAPKQ